jgi:hypothetical protein
VNKRFLTTLAVLAGGVLLSEPAFATLTFTPTFTANFVTNFGPNAVAAENAWIAAATFFSNNFSDSIHINITVDATAGTSPFGQSSTSLIGTTWAILQAAVVADAKTADDATAIGPGGSMFGADPSGGSEWWVSRAQAKALGLIADDLLTDGTTTFGAGNPFSFSGTPGAGSYDFQDVAAHEISEVMGRLGLGGGTVGSFTNSHSLVDAFSYSGAGTRVLGNGGGAGLQGSFSIDAGTNLLKLYNDQFTNHLDYRDWAPGSNDSFNQFSSSGVVNAVSAVDLRELDVIGYDFASTPEPGTMALLGAGLIALGFVRRRFR